MYMNNCRYARAILGQNCIRLSDAAFNDLLFSNVFYGNQCKYAMNIGVAQIRSTLLQFFTEKVPLHISAGRCLQFLK